MKFVRIITILLLVGLFVSSSFAQVVAGPESTTIQLNDNKDSSYTIEFVSHIGNTWTYQVSEAHGRSLSHWNLGIGTCVEPNAIISHSPSAGYEAGTDGSTGFYGIKWDLDEDFSSGEFSFTLDADYPEGTVQALTKAGRKSATGDIIGPICDAAVEEPKYGCGLGTAGEFNTFIFGDFTATSDTEGRLAVGGNAVLQNYSVADKLTPDEQAQYENVMLVGGDLTFTSGRVYYGDVLVGGSATLPIYDIADGDLLTDQDVPIDFAAEEAYLKALSLELAALPPTGTAEREWSGLKVIGDGSSAVQVFDVDGDELRFVTWVPALQGIPEGATLIFNISGENGRMSGGWQQFVPFRTKVLYNYYEATTLSLQWISVEGSILAPLADVVNPQGVIQGTVIAKSWNGSMQQNHVPFEGDLPCVEMPETEPPEAPQIEPASLGDFVWEDTNANGEQDLGEPGVEGVRVRLYTCDDTFVQETTTDDDGKYLFDDLTPADYYVTFSNLPDGYTFTTQDFGTTDANDSDASAGGKTECTTLESGENDMTWDAGIVIGAGITKSQRLDDGDSWEIKPLLGLQAGETVSYQISVENYHYTDDLGFMITDSLSDLVTFESFIGVEKLNSDGNTMAIDDSDYFFEYDEEQHSVSLDYTSTLLSGETLNFLFDVTAADGFGGDMVIENQANVKFSGEDQIDSNVVNVYAVPEPGTVVLLGLGLFGIFGLKRKFKK